MKISACLVLKNEGETILRCLDSLVGIADEIIVGIDSATSDNTAQEVEKFFKFQKGIPHVVYTFTWDNDFSKARNEGMDKATGDYILIMDGHEYFPERWYNISEGSVIPVRDVVKSIVKKTIEEQKPDDCLIQLYQQPFIGETPNNFFMQPRIYRNDPKIRFGRAAHNTIKNTNPEKSIHFPEIILIHDAPESNRTERAKQRVEMNIIALNKDLEKDPADWRAMFYLGNTLLEAERYQEAIGVYDRYFETAPYDNSEKYQAYIHKALCLRGVDEFPKMRDALSLAIGIDPVRRDAYILMAEAYIGRKEYDAALFYVKQALSQSLKTSRMFQSGSASTWHPHYLAAVCYEQLKMVPDTIASLKSAYRYQPRPEWAEMIRKLSGAFNVLIVDSVGSFTKSLSDHLIKREYNVCSSKSYVQRLGEWADFIFCEWADPEAAKASQDQPEKTVIRLHGYEAYALENLWPQIRFNNVKKTIFVAGHVRDRMVEKAGIRPDATVVIPNGVDIDKFKITTLTRDERSIGYAGFINEKKNPFLLLQIIKRNPGFIFHLRADFQSPYWKATFDHELRDCRNVVFHGRYENLSEFWNQMSGVISTSIIESFSFNVAEAMACGCVPYIYSWNGARDIWDPKWIFDTFPEFRADVTPEDRRAVREYVAERYPLDKNLAELEKVLVS
jgi:glycosyltransferase involved in cell wall biosynthesis